MPSTDIYFSQQPPEQFILLQLTPDLLDKKLLIKPASASSSVLCTDSETYQLKDVQQSNSLLFLSQVSAGSDGPPANDKFAVSGEASSWLETTLLSKPPISLAKVPFYNGARSMVGCSRSVLFASIPASTNQIESALLEDLCIDLGHGYVRLESDQVLRLIPLLINSLVVADVELHNISEEQFQAAVEEEDEDVNILFFLLQRLSVNQTPPYDIDGIKVARYLGIHALKVLATSAIPLSTFQSKWKTIVPAQYLAHCTDLSVLSGHFILPVPTQIRYFSGMELSLDGKTRINELLTVKDRWTETEITPFLAELEGGQKAVQSIIMKHAKKVKVGKVVFIEKRGK